MTLSATSFPNALAVAKKPMPVLAIIEDGSVFAGLIQPDQDPTNQTIALQDARTVDSYKIKRDFHELCNVGPAPAEAVNRGSFNIIALHDVVAVFALTPDAWAKWQEV